MLKIYKNTGVQRLIVVLYFLMFLLAWYDVQGRMSIFPNFFVDLGVLFGGTALAITGIQWMGYFIYSLVLSIFMFFIFNGLLLSFYWVYLGFKHEEAE
jgi:hypothetical protein